MSTEFFVLVPNERNQMQASQIDRRYAGLPYMQSNPYADATHIVRIDELSDDAQFVIEDPRM